MSKIESEIKQIREELKSIKDDLKTYINQNKLNLRKISTKVN